MPWFKGWTWQTKNVESSAGKTLLEAIEAIEPPSHRLTAKKPLRLPLRDIYNIGGIGIVPVGRVETGVLRSGMTLTFAPSNLSADLREIEMPKMGFDEALPGSTVGFSLLSAPSLTKNSLQRLSLHCILINCRFFFKK
jgi:elongation factor 1-alpha